MADDLGETTLEQANGNVLAVNFDRAARLKEEVRLLPSHSHELPYLLRELLRLGLQVVDCDCYALANRPEHMKCIRPHIFRECPKLPYFLRRNSRHSYMYGMS